MLDVKRSSLDNNVINGVVNANAVTAIVTAYRRVDQTLTTLGRICECEPPPAEVLVHVDGNQTVLAESIGRAYPFARIILSENNVGPGGGRNRLIKEASCEFVASFDDDSFPIDPDYFARVSETMERFPKASILNAVVFHPGEHLVAAVKSAKWSADFSGGGCVYRRSEFLKTSGYVPLTMAYGMEEVDLAMQMREMGQNILSTPWLRVFHDTNLSRHSDRRVTAASIKNVALLAYLRYPAYFWPIGFIQCFNKIFWLLKAARICGILDGIACIPIHLYRNRKFRSPLSPSTIRSYLKLRRHPISENWDSI